jgi:hypothetical protein
MINHVNYQANSFEVQNPLLSWLLGTFVELLQEYYDLGIEPGEVLLS